MGMMLMKSPTLPPPQALNAVQWGGPDQRGHYEVWYLTLHDPVSRRAFWLRHTLHAPTDGSPGHAALWAFSFEPDGAGVQALDRYPLEAFSDAGPNGLGLGPARYGPLLARGEVGEGADRVAWELTLEPGPFGSFRHIPPKLFRARLAGSAVATPFLSLSVSGWIEAGGVRTRLDRAPGEQGHVHGRRHADRWAWAHVHRFEGTDGVLEGVSAQVRKLGLLLPPASALCVQTGGERLAWSRTRDLWRARSRFELGRWEVEGEVGGGRRVRAVISAAPEAFVSVEYEDPSGERLFCNHTETADADVLVLRPDGSVEQRLEARGTTAFEVGERGPRDPRPRRRLDQGDARIVH